MITLKSVKLTFSPGTVMEKKALRGITLRIEEGEFITVIGSNGAGKSTLLNTISGEVIPTSGSIDIDEENVTAWPAHARAGQVARVFQDPLAGTCADLTVGENLSLATSRGSRRTFCRAITKDQRQHYQELLSRLNLGLEDRMDATMSLLSGGQRQAVSLLMATLSPLKILLLDEHTSALDPKTGAFVMKLTESIVEEQKLTTLMVTHSLQQALHVGTRTIMLHEGRVIYDVRGEERARLTVSDLLHQFGTTIDDDRLLLQ
jgi:putative ABC transport system ATP-binding protein